MSSSQESSVINTSATENVDMFTANTASNEQFVLHILLAVSDTWCTLLLWQGSGPQDL